MYCIIGDNGDREYERIEFELVYRERKTLAIRVEPDRTVTVFAPMGSSRKEVLKAVRKNAPWIIKKLQSFGSIEQYRPKQFTDGERFLYLGDEYALKIECNPTSKTAVVKIKQDLLEVQIHEQDEEAIKKALEKWYRQEAGKIIRERVEHYLPVIGKTPGRVVIKEQKKRWGSCSSRGNLNFNWKTVMAPLPVLDYVVVHELCHLVHLNHSKEFWSLVEQIMPDYRQSKDWLKKSSLIMSF